MDTKLLVRMYNVGVGDCIYLRVPDKGRDYHILIDCGTISKLERLRNAIEHLKQDLPTVSGSGSRTRRLDLLVATHRHADHIKGFDPDLFEDIQIGNIWLSAAMDPAHPQAEETHELHSFAETTMQRMNQLSLSPQLRSMVSLYSLNNADAVKALHEDLPKSNGIAPLYVHAETPADNLLQFRDEIQLTVLAPEPNIDHYYLGQETANALEEMKAFNRLGATYAADVEFSSLTDTPAERLPISGPDFVTLRNRLRHNALGFVSSDSSIQNNVSVVLLLEWRGRRLLFTGDAEWEGEYRENKHNGSWNVMWELHRDALSLPLDFLKIGHHGSRNATPWDSKHKIRRILQKLLPEPQEGESVTPMAAVSTEHTKIWPTIPDPELMKELGRRVQNACEYSNGEGKESFLQPPRTDLHYIKTGEPYVEIEFEPLIESK